MCHAPLVGSECGYPGTNNRELDFMQKASADFIGYGQINNKTVMFGIEIKCRVTNKTINSEKEQTALAVARIQKNTKKYDINIRLA